MIIYVSYNTQELANAFKESNLFCNQNINDVIKNIKLLNKDIHLDEINKNYINMEKSPFLNELSDSFKNGNFYFLFVNNKQGTIGRWQGFELALALKYKGKIASISNNNFLYLLSEAKKENQFYNLLEKIIEQNSKKIDKQILRYKIKKILKKI